MQDALLDQTFARFPQFNGQRVEVQPLEKGGSDRSFFRVAVGDGTSLILARYGRQREENVHYVEIARFLSNVGVRVPEIYFHDESQGLIWMEDLGERDLWSYRNEPWPVRRALPSSPFKKAVAPTRGLEIGPSGTGACSEPTTGTSQL